MPKIRSTNRQSARRFTRSLDQLEARICLTSFGLHHTVFESEDYSLSIHVGDFDGDSDLDIVSAHFDDDRFVWHQNDGRGDYSSHDLPGTFDGASIVTSADLDGDGSLEIIAGSLRDGKLTAFSGLAFGDQYIFSANEISIEVQDIRDVEPADLDNDGDIDLVVAHSKSIRWFENLDGEGNFRKHAAFSDVDSVVKDIVVFDANHDNFLDVAGVAQGFFSHTAAGKPATVVYFGSEIGFRNEIKLEGGGYFASIDAGDIDGDGDEDLLVGRESGVIQKVLNTNIGDSRFQFAEENESVTTEMDLPRAISLDDMDGDGDLDAVVASYVSNRIAWFENRSSGFFLNTANVIANRAAPTTLQVIDIDGDMDLDVVSGFSSRDRNGPLVKIHENRLAGDVNNDGRFDSSDLVAVFAAAEYEDAEEHNSTFATGDWNGDGEFDTADLVVAFRSGSYSTDATPNQRIDIIFLEWHDPKKAERQDDSIEWDALSP